MRRTQIVARASAGDYASLNKKTEDKETEGKRKTEGEMEIWKPRNRKDELSIMKELVRSSPMKDLLDMHVHERRKHLAHVDHDLLQRGVGVRHVAVGEQVGLVRALEEEAQPAVEGEADKGDHMRRAADHQHRPLQKNVKGWVQTHWRCVMLPAMRVWRSVDLNWEYGRGLEI